MVGAQENKTVMRQIFDEVINGKNLDRADELYSDDHELHPDAFGIGRGVAGMKGAFAELHETFPDIRVDVESVVAEGEMVAVRVTFRGTNAQTGEQTTWPEMVFSRFSDGKVVESWEVIDTGRSPDSPPW